MKIGIEHFQRQLLALEPVEFIGVSKILGVPLTAEGDEKEFLPFEEVFLSMLEKYKTLSRRQRKNLHRLLSAATKQDDKG